MKSICLACESYVGNCRPHCNGSMRLTVHSAFRPPKRGHKEWKLLRAIAMPDLDPMLSNMYLKGFSNHGDGRCYDVQTSSNKTRKADNWPKRWREKGFQKDLLERKCSEWLINNPMIKLS